MISSNRQHTLATDLQFEGIGLHTGEQAQLRILPGEANTGYVFVRKDLEGAPSIEAHVHLKIYNFQIQHLLIGMPYKSWDPYASSRDFNFFI